MKKLALNKRRGIKRFTLVDDDDFEKVNKFNWFAHYSKETKSFIAVRTNHIIHSRPLKLDISKRIILSRFIINAKNGEIVDHINHNTLDNRKANLRICNQKENIWNSGKRINNKSGFKGVYKIKNTTNKIWVAHIRANKSIYLGCFETKEQAALAYNKAAKKYHGKFAFLNKI